MDDLSPSSTLGHVYAQLTNLQKLRRNANESLLSLLYASLLSKQPSEPLLNGRQDTDLAVENQTLKTLVKQHEGTLQIIMSKFREQTSLLENLRDGKIQELELALQDQRDLNDALTKDNIRLEGELLCCQQVMREAIAVQEEEETAEVDVSPQRN